MIYDDQYADTYLRLERPQKRFAAMQYDGNNLLDILAFHHDIYLSKSLDHSTKQIEYTPMVPSVSEKDTWYGLDPGDWVVINISRKRANAYKVWGGDEAFKREYRFLWNMRQK